VLFFISVPQIYFHFVGAGGRAVAGSDPDASDKKQFLGGVRKAAGIGGDLVAQNLGSASAGYVGARLFQMDDILVPELLQSAFGPDLKRIPVFVRAAQVQPRDAQVVCAYAGHVYYIGGDPCNVSKNKRRGNESRHEHQTPPGEQQLSKQLGSPVPLVHEKLPSAGTHNVLHYSRFYDKIKKSNG
jgi:hypothetical protein